jgi:hypothetical protein
MIMTAGFLAVERRPDAPKKVRQWSEIENSINRVNVAKSNAAANPKELEFWDD